MRTNSALSAVAGSPVFEATRSPYLVLDRGLRILAINPAYEQATGQPAESLVGRAMFDAFPDNPADPSANGVARLSASLESVLRVGQRHYMGMQRYDVPPAEGEGEFVYKVWAPVNSPIVDGRTTVGVLHHVEDITDILAAPRRHQPGVGPADADAARAGVAAERSLRLIVALEIAELASAGVSHSGNVRRSGFGAVMLPAGRAGDDDDDRGAYHLLDGDGSSLCGRVPASGLVIAPQVDFADVLPPARCPACAAIVSG